MLVIPSCILQWKYIIFNSDLVLSEKLVSPGANFWRFKLIVCYQKCLIFCSWITNCFLHKTLRPCRQLNLEKTFQLKLIALQTTLQETVRFSIVVTTNSSSEKTVWDKCLTSWKTHSSHISSGFVPTQCSNLDPLRECLCTKKGQRFDMGSELSILTNTSKRWHEEIQVLLKKDYGENNSRNTSTHFQGGKFYKNKANRTTATIAIYQ